MQIEGSANSDYMESYENILVTADLITFIIHIKSDLKISTSFLHNFSDRAPAICRMMKDVLCFVQFT